jgi:hypothetical protein
MWRYTFQPRRIDVSEHSHVCGFDLPDAPTEQAKLQGCGFRWTHDNDKMSTKAESTLAHFCPACGAGVWTSHYNEANRALRLWMFELQKGLLEEALLILPSRDENRYAEDRRYLAEITKILADERSVK